MTAPAVAHARKPAASVSLPGKVAVLLSLLGAAIASYLAFHRLTGGNPLCGPAHGCDVVNWSNYSALWGVPTAVYGLLMYLAIGALVVLRHLGPQRLQPLGGYAALALAFAGVGVSAYLTYVELYVLHAICVWCVASAAVVTLILVAIVLDIARPAVLEKR